MLDHISPAKRVSPVHVQIEVTWRCNWRCVHCYQDHHNVEALSTANLISLFDELEEAGTMHVILTGGEPLVRRDLFTLLEALAERRILTTLYSNGHRIDRAMAVKLADLVGAVELSLLAGDPSVHDTLSRVRGSHARVLNAARELRRAGIPVVLKTPIMREALASLKEIELFAMEIGADWNADTEISKSYDGASFPLEHSIDAAQARQFYEEYPQFNPVNGGGMDPGVVDGMCLAGRQYCFIDALGNVYPCLNFKAASDRAEASGELTSARMGNVLETSFDTIWFGAQSVQAIRDASRKTFGACEDCTHSCTPCMALNYEETGELFRPAPSVCHKTFIGSAAGSAKVH
ncbi:MAG: radical SAM protein [Rhodobacterales bacterium]|nr:radical SAM protein [Rhodobacterales bacterium]